MFGMTSVMATKLNGGGAACTAPASAVSEVVELRLRTDSGLGSEASVVRFQYFKQPEVRTVSPSRGSDTGGTLLQIAGVDFLNDGAMCRFGVAQEAVVGRVVSSTLVSCVTPASPSIGAVALEVSFNGGADFTSDGHRFMYEEQAVVEALVPSAGRSGQAGQVVTVAGRHFVGSSELSCLFGRNLRVAVLQHVSSTTVVCAVPSQIAGTVTVSVSNNGVDTGVAGKPFALEAQRSMVSLTPSRGPVQGGSLVTIEVVGGISSGAESVTCVFGGSRVQGHVLEGTRVECMSTGVTAAGKVKVGVEGVSGLVGSLDFEFYFGPVVSRLVPSRGALSGGAMVTLHGTGFSGKGLLCRFGSGIAGEGTGRYLSSTMVSCMAPSVVEAGSVIVEVSINGGADYSGGGKEYSYEMGATVDAVLPSRGQAGAVGQVVTVVGKHFVQTAELSCFFGVNESAVRQYLSSTMVTCFAARQSAGIVRVVSNNG